MFDVAVFDMDGLLIDSERAIMQAWLEISQRLGVPIAAGDYVRTVGLTSAESDRVLLDLLGDEQLFAQARLVVDHELNVTQGGVFALKQGALQVLEKLAKAGIRCAVASSSRRHEIEHRLGSVGVLGRFEAIAGGDEVARGKPDPAVYQLAIERLGVAAHAALAFEDSENGTRAALAAGLRVVVVPDLKPPPADLMLRAYERLENLGEAHSHLRRWFGRGRW